MGRERIAVTGLGIVSALGADARTSFKALVSGARGFGPVTLFDAATQRAQIAAEVKGLHVRDIAPRGREEAWSRSDALAVVAASEALRSSDLPLDRTRYSLCVGGTTGGMYEAEAVLSSLPADSAPEAPARRLLSYPLSTTTERIAECLGSAERALTICSACSSGAVALVQAAAWLSHGRADVVLAGGTDGLCELTFTGFNALGAMDVEPCRPFDATRAGLSLGEGAAFLVLERESHAKRRGARVLAWFTGWAVLAEAHHITHPEPSGRVAAQIIGRALSRASRTARDVDYVNAHGTGTAQNDAMEAQALARALGTERERVWVSSSKGQIGHTLGACGAIEAALTILSLDAGVIAATGGLKDPDASLGLKHVPAPQERLPLRCALSNSFGFGGTGCVLVFEHASATAVPVVESTTASLPVITGVATWSSDGLREGMANAEFGGARTEPSEARASSAMALLDPARSRRFDASSATVTATAQAALLDARASAAETGLIAGTAYGNVERSVTFLRRVRERGPRLANPAEFPHLVPSAASGNASIYLGLRGPVVSVSDLATSAEAACELGLSLLEVGLVERVLAGSAEPHDPVVSRVLSPLHSDSVGERGEGAGFIVLETEHAARARGARIYATITAWAFGLNASDGSFEFPGLPASVRNAAVVLGTSDAELLRMIEHSNYREARRIDVAKRAGQHEALGAIAMAVGATLLARDRLDVVLVCARTRGRSWVCRLEPAASSESANNSGA